MHYFSNTYYYISDILTLHKKWIRISLEPVNQPVKLSAAEDLLLSVHLSVCQSVFVLVGFLQAYSEL